MKDQIDQTGEDQSTIGAGSVGADELPKTVTEREALAITITLMKGVQKDLKHTKYWYSIRLEEIKKLFKGTSFHQKVCAIIANGSPEVFKSNSYAVQYNILEHQNNDLERENKRLKEKEKQWDKMQKCERKRVIHWQGKIAELKRENMQLSQMEESAQKYAVDLKHKYEKLSKANAMRQLTIDILEEEVTNLKSDKKCLNGLLDDEQAKSLKLKNLLSKITTKLLRYSSHSYIETLRMEIREALK